MVNSQTRPKSKPVITVNLAKAMRDADDGESSVESGVDSESDVSESESSDWEEE